MIQGKKDYEDIKIPDNISEAFENGCKRGKRAVFRRNMSKAGAALAACFCLVVLTGNETVYATLSGIPVIGTFVQMIHSGEGGQITDGMQGYVEGKENSIQIKFTQDNGQVPHYDVKYMEMPGRIQVTLDGVRGFDRDSFEAQVKQVKGVTDMYFVTYLDDSAVRFVIELEAGYSYDVKEYKEPGYLDITFAEGMPQENRQVWLLRSQEMDMGEPLAAIQETYMNQGASIVKTQSGKFAVVIGTYGSEAEAESALVEIGQYGNEKVFEIEEGKLSGRPQ